MTSASDAPDATDRDDSEDASRAPNRGRTDPEPSPLIVGVGASAGGVQALQSFFGALPTTDHRLAFVVSVHLPADSPSHLVSILQEATDLAVEAAEDGQPVAPNRVYVSPPGKRVWLGDNVLLVADAQAPHDSTTIDQLFRSLADSRGQDCAGIVLSGTGRDGTLGVRSIKEMAGLTLAQAPEDAGHDGMPRSALRTGLVDIVAPAAELPARLLQALQTVTDISTVSSDPPRPQVERSLQRIFRLVRTATGHDFASYRRSTILRRLQRRMQIRSRENLHDYLDLLSVDAEEVHALEREFLITVTSFFRDPEAFAALEETVVPALFDHAPDEEPVRVWVAGCATGEEAYSLAMLLLEESDRRSSTRGVQVFATDIDTDAIGTAREGRYPATIRADVTADRVDEFFEQDGNYFRVTPRLREAVLFAHHDLLSDPPFSKLDLVSCRNLLIYLNPEMQEQVFRTLHYALRMPGFLLLGRSEAASRAADLFQPLDPSTNIYEARDLAPESTRPLIATVTSGNSEPLRSNHRSVREPGSPRPLEARVHGQALLSDVASVLVREDRSIVHLSDAASTYLQYRSGTPTLTGAVPEAIRNEVAEGLTRAFDQGVSTTHYFNDFEGAGTATDLRVSIRPIRDPDASAPLVLVRFEPVDGAGDAGASGTVDGDSSTDRSQVRSNTAPSRREGSAQAGSASPRSSYASDGNSADAGTSGRESPERQLEIDAEDRPDLEKELLQTHEKLQTVTEEYETTREEMEAANEELLSMNEELQSKNEELETSKEELQSVNEELEATNRVLKGKLAELRDANSMLENLMASTHIATLFLDNDLRIRRFTPQTTRLFNIRTDDVGRPISDFTQRFDYDDLLGDAREVLRELDTVKREIRQNDEHWFLVRIRPYRTVEDRIEGVVITFVEITDRKQAERVLHRSERFHRLAAEASGVGTWDLDLDTGEWRLSPQMAALFDYRAEPYRDDVASQTQEAGKDRRVDATVIPGEMVVSRERWLTSIHPDDRLALERALRRVQQTSDPFELTFRVQVSGNADGKTLSSQPGVRWLYARGDLLGGGDRSRLHGAAIDVTEQIRREQEIIQAAESVRHGIGQDLHDVLTTELASISVRLDNLTTGLQGTSDERDLGAAADTAKNLAENVREAVEQARNLADTLIPAGIQEDLPAALRTLCNEQQELSEPSYLVETALGDDRLGRSLDDEVAVHLYRIVREAILNARQHADAERVTVGLETEGDRLLVTVHDDGIGPPPEGFSEGRGVRLMRYRADLIGASFRIGTADGGGTLVRCELPLALGRAPGGDT